MKIHKLTQIVSAGAKHQVAARGIVNSMPMPMRPVRAFTTTQKDQDTEDANQRDDKEMNKEAQED